MVLLPQNENLHFPLPFFSLSQNHKNNLQPLLGLNSPLSSLLQTGVVSCLSLWLTRKTPSLLMAGSSWVQTGQAALKTVIFGKHIAFSQ